MSMYSFCMFMYLHRASWHSSATLTEVFPCFFLSCKAKCQGKTRTLPNYLCCSMYCLFCVVLCIVCVLYYCHRVATQLQLTNTGCPRRNVPDFGMVFLMLKYTDITQNTYVQSWTVTEIMAGEKCGLLAGPRTVPVSWQVLSMFVLERGVGFSSH